MKLFYKLFKVFLAVFIGMLTVHGDLGMKYL